MKCVENGDSWDWKVASHHSDKNNFFLQARLRRNWILSKIIQPTFYPIPIVPLRLLLRQYGCVILSFYVHVFICLPTYQSNSLFPYTAKFLKLSYNNNSRRRSEKEMGSSRDTLSCDGFWKPQIRQCCVYVPRFFHSYSCKSWIKKRKKRKEHCGNRGCFLLLVFAESNTTKNQVCS